MLLLLWVACSAFLGSIMGAAFFRILTPQLDMGIQDRVIIYPMAVGAALGVYCGVLCARWLSGRWPDDRDG